MLFQLRDASDWERSRRRREPPDLSTWFVWKLLRSVNEKP